MPTWPTTKASTNNVDSGSDKPRLAREDIKQNIDNVNSIIDIFNIGSVSEGQTLVYDSDNARFNVGNVQQKSIGIFAQTLTSFDDSTRKVDITWTDQYGLVSDSSNDKHFDINATCFVEVFVVKNVASGGYGTIPSLDLFKHDDSSSSPTLDGDTAHGLVLGGSVDTDEYYLACPQAYGASSSVPAHSAVFNGYVILTKINT
tara:strand:- start:5594 stop:6199 length:606 start_codon:yes stop_codon:yes gene_type:complete